jgi:hypothetical protein
MSTYVELAFLRAGGMSAARIAAETGMTRSAVIGALWRGDKRGGVPPRPRVKAEPKPHVKAEPKPHVKKWKPGRILYHCGFRAT